MSLTAKSSAASKCAVLLKTADQYEIWKSRVSDACWCATTKNVFNISDEECKAAIALLEDPETKSEHRAGAEWLGKCWTIITISLHDEVYLKITHVSRGLLKSLLSEIGHALVVTTLEEVQPLRLELYGATMQKDCGSDLQAWINYILERAGKLLFLKKEVPQEELVAIFLKGLHPIPFQQLQVYFAIPGQMPKTFESVVSATRKFASNPAVAMELAKLKSAGVSQNMFPMVPLGPQAPQSKQKQTARCRLFASTGTCRFGNRCKFVHIATPASGHSTPQAQPPRQCAYCNKIGHTEEVCHTKKRVLGQLQPQTAAVAVSSSDADGKTEFPETEGGDQFVNNHFQFVLAARALCSVSSHSLQHSSTARDQHKERGNKAYARPSPSSALEDRWVSSKKGDASGFWVLDSGATCCATSDETECIDIRDCRVHVTSAGSSFEVKRIGTALVNTLDDLGRPVQLKMRNTLISPIFPYKLLALQLLTSKGYEVVMGQDRMRISNPFNDSVFVGTKDPKTQLFFLQQCATSHALLARSYGEGNSDMAILWKLHLRHGHRNFDDIGRQYNLSVPKQMPACVSCIMGKAHVHPHASTGFERATRVAEGFHSDFRGPFSVQTPQGALYLLTLIDDFSRCIFGFLVKSQTEWLEIWTKFVVQVEAEIGRPNCISWLLSDNGGVYKSTAMAAFCASKGIQQRFSAPYAQWMDHTAERNMRTIGEMAVTTLVHANLPKSAWGHAVVHAIDVINRTADSANNNKEASVPPHFSRLEKWKQKELPGQTKGLYPLGCLAFKLVPSELRTKLDNHAIPSVYLGLDPRCRAFLLGSLFDLDLSTSAEVTFVENVFPFRKIKHRESPASLLWGTENNLGEGDPRLGMFADSDASGMTKVLDRQALKSIGILPPSSALPEDEPCEESTLEPTLRRSSRVRQPPPELLDYNHPRMLPSKDVAAFLALSETQLQTVTPKSPEKAMLSSSSSQWLEAMNREKQCHVKNGTFGEAWSGPNPCPKSVPAGWVYKIKHRGSPIEEKDLLPGQFKARVVIRGQFMQEGLDFNDTFAPVAKPGTIRAVFAVATKQGCKLKAGDIETAFLSADIDCEVWVKMPTYWGRADEAITGEKLDLPPRRLLKGVPGIPQGSRLFYEAFSSHLQTMGWLPSVADKCLFLNAQIIEFTAVIIWVDDFIFVHQHDATWHAFLKQLRVRFRVPTIGDLSTFLGMSVIYNPALRVMHISQGSTINNLLERAQMTDCNPVTTPCVQGLVFTKKDCPETPDHVSTSQYRSLIALANFISCWTRPDITYTVNKLCKYMANPGTVHWQALKHLLRYLKGTQQLGLSFNFAQTTQSVPDLHGFTDASYADCPDTSKSTIGYVFYYGGAILSWFSKLHSFVTTSTNHAEYAALAAGAKEAQWLVYLFEQLDPKAKHTPVPLFVDNSGVISLVFNPVDHQSNKHIRISCHFARELTDLQVIAPQRVSTDKNLADIFTKALGGVAVKILLPHYVASQEASVRGEVLASSLIPPSQPLKLFA